MVALLGMTVGEFSAITTSLATFASVWVAWRATRKSLITIHAVVNSRLDAALEKIKSLESVVRALTEARHA